MDIKRDVRYGIYFILLSIVLSIIIYFIGGYPILSGIRAFLGFAYVLFLPGYVVVRCFFNDVDAIEKAALSFGLSIALVILSIMFSNLVLKIPITALTNFVVILVVMMITVLIKLNQTRLKRLFRRT
jgi:uncharacterized membrane protein